MSKFNPLDKTFWQKPDRKIWVGFVTATVVFVGALFGFDLDPADSAVGAFVIGKIVEYIVPSE